MALNHRAIDKASSWPKPSATVSVKIVGTLFCLLVPSMLVYKVWWLNRDKQLWEGQGGYEKEKTAFALSVLTIFVRDCSYPSLAGYLHLLLP